MFNDINVVAKCERDHTHDTLLSPNAAVVSDPVNKIRLI